MMSLKPFFKRVVLWHLMTSCPGIRIPFRCQELSPSPRPFSNRKVWILRLRLDFTCKKLLFPFHELFLYLSWPLLFCFDRLFWCLLQLKCCWLWYLHCCDVMWHQSPVLHHWIHCSLGISQIEHRTPECLEIKHWRLWALCGEYGSNLFRLWIPWKSMHDSRADSGASFLYRFEGFSI